MYMNHSEPVHQQKTLTRQNLAYSPFDCHLDMLQVEPLIESVCRRVDATDLIWQAYELTDAMEKCIDAKCTVDNFQSSQQGIALNHLNEIWPLPDLPKSTKP